MGQGLSRVKYSDLWGLREEKYRWLGSRDVRSTKWRKITPLEPFYFLVPREEKGYEVYENFTSIQEIFLLSSTGIVTARDDFVIDLDKDSLKAKIRIFTDPRNTNEYVKELLRSTLGRKDIKDVENYAWRVREAREELSKVTNLDQSFTRILYRPFDERWIFYHPAVVWRTREEVMQHMLRPNLALLGVKRIEVGEFSHVSCTTTITDHHALSLKETNYVFPLYRYHSKLSPRLWDSLDQRGEVDTGEVKEVNIEPKFLTNLEGVYGQLPEAESVFYYIYAILYANTYRQKYQEFLKIDFPRIPFTKNYELFKKLAGLGQQLVDLHLLKSPELNNPVAKFYGQNGSYVEKREYEEKEQRVYINELQYFSGIAPEVWSYQIGGYQVLDKWLKDRKGRTLSAEDVKHYCQVATALSKTIEVQKEIDKLYPGVERTLLG